MKKENGFLKNIVINPVVEIYVVNIRKKYKERKDQLSFVNIVKKRLLQNIRCVLIVLKKHYEEYLILKSKEKLKEPPKVESPKVEPPKLELLKVEPLKAELPKTEPPKVEPLKTESVEPIEKIINTVENKLIPEEKIPEITPKERLPYNIFKRTQMQSDFITEDIEAMDRRYYLPQERKNSYFNSDRYYY